MTASGLYTADFQATYHGLEGNEREVTPFRCHTGTVREREWVDEAALESAR